jgi:hypothetical protein
MKSRLSVALVSLFTLSLLAACSSGSDDQSQNSTSQGTVQLLGPTPSLAGVVEIGDAIPLVPLRPAVTSASSISAPESKRQLAQSAAATSDSSLGPLSTTNPLQILGADRVVPNPWQAKNLDDLKLATLPDGNRTRMPTGKWSKGFFYQSPRNIDAYFQFNGVPKDPRNQGGDTNEFNIFAYPNKLNLDDRIGMLSVSFPSRRYISYGLDPNADVYNLSNPLKTDTILYPIAPNTRKISA